ncbi:MAG: Fic family protein [Gammaproteobacteria bacterium]|nr:Fic family protein [Gammaproteobacteria bacterium]
MDWNAFEFSYGHRGMAALSAQLIQIDGYREAALNLVLPPMWREQLDGLNRVRAVHGTTALEGNPLSEEEVSEQIDQLTMQPDASEMSREQAQIRNVGLAQDWIKERFTPDQRPVTYEDVMRMHALVTQGSDETKNVPGELRQHSVVVGTEALGGVHRGAPANVLAELMGGFIVFINGRRMAEEHPVVRALVAHFFLVTLHPFGDGNGRVSRLLEAAMLYRGGYNVLGFYGLSNYFYRNGDEYKLLLQQSRRKKPFDLTDFVSFGVRGFAAELKGINNFIKTKLNRLVYRDTLVRAFNQHVGPRRRILNQREYRLLDFLLRETEPTDPFSDEPSLSIRFDELLAEPYVESAYRNVTQRTFRRELVRLHEMGFIKVTRDADEGVRIEVDFGAIGRY